MHSLHNLPPNTRAHLVEVGGERPFRRRLMELGFLPGSELLVIRNIEVGGVMEVEVRHCRVTLRKKEAQALFVTEDSCTRPGCCVRGELHAG